jgi:DNA-binding NarL/FixJ family response regulator
VITILLVDDHQLVRAGLRALLESVDDLRVVGEAGDGDAAVDLAVAERPDVVLMDLSMPRVDGVEATRRLAAAGVDTRVVVLTSFADQPRVQAALAAGAVGYLLKDSDPRDVISAVRQAAAGHVPIDARVAQALLPGSQTPAAGHTLSGREAEVLSLVAQGMANKQIARQLGISERTVKAHLGKVFRQIGVADRTSAALWAREHLGTSGVGMS